MTTKSPEQEAREWCNKVYPPAIYNDGTNSFEVSLQAHLDGQKVGYLRALDEVLEGCIKDRFWLGPADRFDPIIEIAAVKRIINNLKAKAGKE